jgi:hypothetical protein
MYFLRNLKHPTISLIPTNHSVVFSIEAQQGDGGKGQEPDRPRPPSPENFLEACLLKNENDHLYAPVIVEVES